MACAFAIDTCLARCARRIGSGIGYRPIHLHDLLKRLSPLSNTDQLPADRRRRVKIIGNVFIALLLLATVELGSYVALRFGILPKVPNLFYVPPPKINKEIHNLYYQYLHPVVGWATEIPEEKRYSIDIESRPNMVFPDETNACLSIYGDSFTFGDEVSDEEAWGNQLSALLDCKVANYGQGGYGTDQAYLRYELNEGDLAPINLLAIYPDNVLRNLNQYRPFLAGPHASWTALKPRFIFEDGRLRFIPQLELSYEEFIDATESPEKYFEHEYFLPGSSAGLPRYEFPYSFALAKFATSKKIQNRISKRPTWIDYLNADHPSDALAITTGIAEKFSNVAYIRGHDTIVVIYPTVSSHDYYKRTGIVATAPITAELDKLGIKHLDLHSFFAEHLGDMSICEVITNNCTGHFNAAGNIAVATALKTAIGPLISNTTNN